MNHLTRLIAGTVFLVALTACHAPTDTNHTGVAMELKIHAVPAQQTGKIAEALGNAMGGKATVTSPAPGKLLVYAPHDAQVSIDTAITTLGKSPSAAAPTQVNLHFWIVDAQAGPGPDDDALKPLSAPLDVIRKNTGPLHFQLDQVVAAMTSSGHNGSIVTAPDNGYPHAFDFQVNDVTGTTINLSLGYNDHGQSGLAKFMTQLDLESGHYVVLAQAPGACAPALMGQAAPPCPQKPTLRLLIVRADRLPPHA
ncbi:MAG: hypothetical protein M3Y93_09845 [Pseudomonadota bacterium]|nr:hypothetical protein [Pseudomonadota bacterium]